MLLMKRIKTARSLPQLGDDASLSCCQRKAGPVCVCADERHEEQGGEKRMGDERRRQPAPEGDLIGRPPVLARSD